MPLNWIKHPLAAQIKMRFPGQPPLSPRTLERNERYKQVIIKCIENDLAAKAEEKTFINKQLRNNSKSKSKMRNHTFVTISLPIVEPDFQDLGHTHMKYHSIVDNWLNLCPFEYLDGATYCIEFYGQELQLHPHIHILINHVMSPARLIRDFSRKFKIAKNFIDVKPGLSASLETRQNYIQGIKIDDKTPQVIKDKEMRLSLELEDYYEIIS